MNPKQKNFVIFVYEKAKIFCATDSSLHGFIFNFIHERVLIQRRKLNRILVSVYKMSKAAFPKFHITRLTNQVSNYFEKNKYLCE